MSSENPTPPQRLVPIPSKGAVPPCPVVSMAIRKPERRARINKGETGAMLRSPMCSSEYADTERGLAVERAQTYPFPGEEGEGQQSCDTVVSKFGKAEPLPPIEAVPKRSALCVVNTSQSASAKRSPMLEAARRQPVPFVGLRVEERGPLARAAAYIRERVNRRSPHIASLSLTTTTPLTFDTSAPPCIQRSIPS